MKKIIRKLYFSLLASYYKYVFLNFNVNKRNKKPMFIYAKTMGDKSIIKLTNNLLKKNQTFTFSADIIFFDTLRIYHGKKIFSSGYVEITKTNISVYYYSNKDILITTLEHGLTLEGKFNISISINSLQKLSLTITTETNTFFANDIQWVGCRGIIQAESIGSDFSNVSFSWDTTEYNKDIWVYGDSWVSLDANNWPYYLLNEKDNFLVSGYGGGTSPYSYIDFIASLTHSAPKYAVWALGMNEGDSKTSINLIWRQYFNLFLVTCNKFCIIPILVTIPNTPTINHTYKNEDIRNSGYRYIDFAAAMNANEFGKGWLTGYAAPDGNHPSELGAQVLAEQVLKDFPEIK